ncbi:hypothetical protein QQ045_017101 [Rhodiola kirilowii]
MSRFLWTINLDDENANYTIGQMLTHLQLSVDKSEFDKVERLLKRREERIRGEMLGVIERLKEEAVRELEAEAEKVKRAAAKREDEISREFLSEMEQMVKGLKDVEAKYEELVKWKVVLEESFDEVEKEKVDLVEEVRILREMNKELKKREEAEKVRVLELMKWKITLEESFENLKKENSDLVVENLRLKKEVRVLRETNDELKMREEALKVRVLELETDIEVEEGLRVKAEDDLEALEKSYKERFGRVDQTTNEAGGCSIRSDFGTPNGYVVDLTEEADGVWPGNTQTGNLIEDSTCLDPASNLKESSPRTPRTNNKTESRDATVKPAAPINTTEANPASHGSGIFIHIPSDSDDDTSDSPLRIKRKRVRSMNKENSFSSNDEHASPQLPVNESKRTPGTATNVFRIRPSPSDKVQWNMFHSSDAEWRTSVLNKLKFTGSRLFNSSSSSSDE